MQAFSTPDEPVKKPRIEAAAKHMAPPVDAARIHTLTAELARRRCEALRIYEPLPSVKKFHDSRSREKLVYGCLGGESKIYDPVLKEIRRVDSISTPFHVWALDEKTNQAVIASANKPFVKGIADLYEFVLSNKETIVATMDHRVLVESGEWFTFRNALDLLPRLLNHGGPTLRLLGHKYIRTDQFYDFNVPIYHNYYHSSIWNHNSNRGGKTLSICAEAAMAVTGQSNGKYPERDGRCYFVGKDGKHIGEVLWRKLSRAGAFQMIRDEHTKLWRAVRPHDHYDRKNRAFWKPAPPLIPPRMIEQVAWENKAQGIPNKVVLKNGWEICFFSGLADPPNGVDIDLLIFDEELYRAQLWYAEGSARLMDRKGYFIWGATPQAATETMYDLYLRSIEDDPNVKSFFLSIFDNPHIDDEEKLLLTKKYSEGSLDYKVRILGQFAVLGYRVYPDWDMQRTHGVDAFPVPGDWTRYAAIDPGHQITAVLFGAVPPADEEDYPQGLYLYDELYIQRCDADTFAEQMQAKCYGQEFEAFIIDRRMSRQTEVASGKTIEAQYEDALRRHGVRCKKTGFGFTAGSDDVNGGISMVHRYMRIDGKTGQPGVFCLREKLPHFQDEIAVHRYKTDPHTKLATDDIVRKRDHLMAAFRMEVSYEPKWKARQKAGDGYHPVLDFLKAKEQRKRKAERSLHGGSNYIRLGPGPK